MLQLDPSDPQELAFAIHRAVKLSGLSQAENQEPLAGARLGMIIPKCCSSLESGTKNASV
jgi:hypothetical protein